MTRRSPLFQPRVRAAGGVLCALGLVLTLGACDEASGDPSRAIGSFSQAGQTGTWAFTALGRIESASGLRHIGTTVSGILESVPVREGDTVTAGQVIATVACADRKAQVAVAEAQVGVAEAEQAKLIAGPRSEDIRAAEAALRRARAVRVDAEAAFAKAHRLHRTGVASERTMESSTAELEIAQAELAQAAAQLDALRKGTRPEDLARGEAALTAARATHEVAVTMLRQCSITSPLDGRVARVNRRAGEQVSTATPESIVEIVDARTLEIRTQVDERFVGLVKEGQSVEFWLEGESDRFPGSVERLSSAMGRKTVSANAPADKADRDVLEVIVTPTASGFPQVHGLRVIVGFHSAVAGVKPVKSVKASSSSLPTAQN